MSARYYEAVGRRKTSSARVRLYPAPAPSSSTKGLPRILQAGHRDALAGAAVVLTDTRSSYNVSILVAGAATTGRPARLPTASPERCASPTKTCAGAEEERPANRDARAKERKKYGLKRARKAPQYTKR